MELHGSFGFRQQYLASKSETPYTFTYQNGRRYASTELGHYYMPNDEPEIQRLNEQHWILTQVKGGSLHRAPIPDKAGLKVLDVGCGSGIWPIQMAEDYPKAMVIGMDVSPIQPKNKPANVEWITQDMEDEWPYPESYFDLIHLSLVHGCVADWGKMMQKITKHLAPGGWVEHQEFSLCRQYMVDENNKPIPMSEKLGELPAFFRWNRLMEQAGANRGRQLQLGPHLATFQKQAGLQHVTETVFPHKWGTWPSDPKERELGARTMLSTMSGIEGFTTVMFTKALGWSLEDTQAFIADTKRDMRNDQLRKVIDLHVVYGQKPGKVTDSTRKASSGSWIVDSKYLQIGLGVLVGAAAASTLSFWLARRR